MARDPFDGPHGWVERVLGPYRVVADRSWDHGDSAVTQVRDTTGTDWFVKRHGHIERYAREVSAYRRWVPVLGAHAPRLRAHDDGLRTLLLSAVPGRSDDEQSLTPELQHQAGTLLRTLHDVVPPVPWPDFAEQRMNSFRKWGSRATGLVDARSVDFVRGQIAGLSALPAPDLVPCHLDYSPRNWIVADGRLHVIDFEWTRPHCWLQDLARLYFGPWQRRPDARAAFLDGYGRSVGGDDLAVLLALGAAAALSSIVWARDHGDTGFEEDGRRNLAGLLAGTVG
jgi:Ser/Thr protein kinase RdoA (MazF antagonist)